MNIVKVSEQMRQDVQQQLILWMTKKYLLWNNGFRYNLNF
jgi:hypothetical protein